MESIQHTIVEKFQHAKRSDTFKGGLIVLLLFAIFLYWKHAAWIHSPNDYFIDGGTDGLKNYMTTAYHLKRDSSLLHYTGMNYPYGEHILFTDNQPIFANLLQLWNRHIGDISDYTVGAMNIFLLVSMLFGVLLIFLLYRKLHLPVWLAGILSLGMAAFSPQYLRFTGHFGLSHIWVIPLLLLLLWNYEQKRSKRYFSLFIGFLVIFSAQLHFYYFGMSALFVTFYLLTAIVQDFSWRNIRKRINHWIAMILAPFIVLSVWIRADGSMPDRPGNPYGFLAYCGEWEGVFLPYEGMPIYEWIDNYIISIKKINSEALSYVGLVVTAFTLWAIFSRFRIFGKSWHSENSHKFNVNYLYNIWWAAFCMVIFSCVIPYILDFFPALNTIFGFIKQFRSMGRFNWIYFYVGNIIAFYAIYNWSKRMKDPEIKWLTILLPLTLFAYEVYQFQAQRKTPLLANNLNNAPNIPEDAWLRAIDFSKYQAMIPLPYYHMGSENIWLEPNINLFMAVQRSAYKTGCPDMGVNMSRTSVEQTCKSLSLVLEHCHSPEILRDLPDTRPLLLVSLAAKRDTLLKPYQQLYKHAKLLFANEEFQFHELALDNIRKTSSESYRDMDTLYQSIAHDHMVQGWKATTPKPFVVYNGFDQETSTENKFRGSGAHMAVMNDTFHLYTGSMPKGKYTWSIWSYIKKDLGMILEGNIEERQKDNGNILQKRRVIMRFHLRQMAEDWALFEVPFEVKEDNSQVDIFLEKKGIYDTYFIDESLIKGEHTTLYRKDGKWISKDNYWYLD